MYQHAVSCLLVLCLFLPASLPAQKPADLKKSGEKALDLGRWAEARALLLQYQQEKPGDPSVLTRLGIAHYHLRQGEKAREYLEYVAAKQPDSKDVELYFYLGRTLHGLGEYDRAMAAYKAFLRVAAEKDPRRAGVVDDIRRCARAGAIPASDAAALVENMSDRLNTAGDEFAPLPSVNHPDRLYFSAAREGCTGGRRDADGYEDTLRGEWCADMFLARRSTRGWEETAPLSSLLNTSRHEVALDFNRGGQVLYFSRGFTLYSGEICADTAGRKDEYAVQPPLFASPMQAEEGDGAPFFVNDTVLLFASRRPGGQGGLDLYITERRAEGWTAPQNLGPAVNSAYDETMPFLAADGRTLYFSSNRNTGMGGLDVYKAVFDAALAAWQTPANLGAPVNSPFDDAFFRLTADGRSAYLASDRFGSLGARDLYVVYFKDAQPEQYAAGQPVLFTEIEKKAAGAQAEQAAESAGLNTLPYTTDRDVLSAENLRQLDKAAALAQQYPEAQVLVTVFTDETGPSKFDVYYGIKRAELVGKALLDRGVGAGRVVLRSVGANYPLARAVLDDKPNPMAPTFNRRVEVELASPSREFPPETKPRRPEVSELMLSGGARQYSESVKGLSFSVEAATTRQILTDDALYVFGDIRIESRPGDGMYYYTAGLFKKFQQAAQLRDELKKQNFAEATVIAYIDGVRISKAEAVALLRKYPELQEFIRK